MNERVHKYIFEISSHCLQTTNNFNFTSKSDKLFTNENLFAAKLIKVSEVRRETNFLLEIHIILHAHLVGISNVLYLIRTLFILLASPDQIHFEIKLVPKPYYTSNAMLFCHRNVLDCWQWILFDVSMARCIHQTIQHCSKFNISEENWGEDEHV